MEHRVALVGLGYTPFRPTSAGVSYKELMFEAATRAYADCGFDPRSDIDSFVCCSEDFHEGTSIFDEYVPDQIGGALRPVQTITGDGLQGFAAAYMLIRTGIAEAVTVEAHSKASNMLEPLEVMSLALDPIYVRPLGANPHFVAALEMDAYLQASGQADGRRACAQVVAKNRSNALANPAAAYGAALTPEDVLNSEPTFEPLRKLDMSGPADGAIVVVLASEERARRARSKPVWVNGIGWCTEANALDSRDWAGADYARRAAEMAYRAAGVTDPARQIDFAEVDDTYSYKEIQHLDALGVFDKGRAARATLDGVTDRDGRLPVNASGGSLGVGHLLEATGLAKVVEVALQLRGEAGPRQLSRAQRGLAMSWRGVPTATGAVAVLEAGER
jgi:acetyl-CoA C-acetyltransferase